MKLKVTERFYDKKECTYVEKEAVIEREDDRAQELIKAGVAESFEENEEDKKPEDEKPEDEKTEDEKPEKGKKKSKKTE